MVRLKQISLVVFLAAVALAAVVLLGESRRDRQGPVIEMDQTAIEIGVEDAAGLLAGITARDGKDGDVTSSLVVEGLSPFTAKGERLVTVAAFDSDNQVTKAVRTLRYTDYTPPRFSLSAPLAFPAGIEPRDITAALSAWDCLDGDITRRITCTNLPASSLRTDLPGEYPVLFSVSNSAGDIQRFVATVQIYDPQLPRQRGVGLTRQLLYCRAGDSFDPWAYLDTVTAEGRTYQMTAGQLVHSASGEILPRDQVQIDNPVNTAAPGWYEVCYTPQGAGEVQPGRLLVCVQA